MTHLYIELNTGLTEEVNYSIISKLYELAISGDLDNTSDLKGRLHTATAKDAHVSYLTTHFPELYITADTLYITFADSYIEEYMKNYIGDGTGTVLAYILSFISSGKAFGESYNNPYLGNNKTWVLTYNLKILPTIFNEFGTLFEGITKIGQGAFNEFRNLTSITLPSTVTEIGNTAFLNTYALTSLNLENILSIGASAFANSHIGGDISLPNLTYIDGTAFLGTRITSISLPSSITLGGNGIFSSCSNLTQVTGLSTITDCKSTTFNLCSNLETINIDFSIVTNIGNSAFNGCQKLNLGNLVLPSLISLGYGAFTSCKKLYSVDLSSSSITKLYNGTFKDCSNLTTVVLPALNGCTEIESNAFLYCTNLLTISNLSNVTTIGRDAFNGCSNLDITNWDLSSVTSLGQLAFKGCSKLKGTLNLSGVLTIDILYTELFKGCSGLEKIILGSPGTIGASSNNASRSMFEECNSLKVIDITLLDTISMCNNCIIKSDVFEALIIRNSTTVPAVEKQSDYSGALKFDKIIQNSNARIYVPRAMLSTYANDSEWSAISSYILAIEDYTPSV